MAKGAVNTYRASMSIRTFSAGPYWTAMIVSMACVQIPMISPTHSDFISPTIPGLIRPGDARLSAA